MNTLEIKAAPSYHEGLNMYSYTMNNGSRTFGYTVWASDEIEGAIFSEDAFPGYQACLFGSNEPTLGKDAQPQACTAA